MDTHFDILNITIDRCIGHGRNHTNTTIDRHMSAICIIMRQCIHTILVFLFLVQSQGKSLFVYRCFPFSIFV